MSLFHPIDSRWVFLLVFTVACGGVGSGELALPQEPTESEQLTLTRRQMTERWKKIRAFDRDEEREQEAKRGEKPIMSFSEATRESGHFGTVWVWSRTGRPVAMFSQSKAYGEALWGYELAALADGVSVIMHDGWKWSPRSAMKVTPFERAPAAADNAPTRLRQMKALARRITVSESYFDEPIELRLLPSPIHRYHDDRLGVIDGGMFIFAHGTNPEGVLVVECWRKEPESIWTYGLLPLAGAGLVAKLDGNMVWSKMPTRQSRAQEVYSTWLETEDK